MPERKLSDAELQIMEHFWQHGSMKSDALATLVSNRGWKPTTLLTFLSRLVAKGMLAIEKQGKANLYSPLVQRAEYARCEGQAFLQQLYGGSARDFLAAMVDGNALSAEELSEMRRWLAQQEVDEHD